MKYARLDRYFYDSDTLEFSVKDTKIYEAFITANGDKYLLIPENNISEGAIVEYMLSKWIDGISNTKIHIENEPLRIVYSYQVWSLSNDKEVLKDKVINLYQINTDALIILGQFLKRSLDKLEFGIERLWNKSYKIGGLTEYSGDVLKDFPFKRRQIVNKYRFLVDLNVNSKEKGNSILEKIDFHTRDKNPKDFDVDEILLEFDVINRNLKLLTYVYTIDIEEYKGDIIENITSYISYLKQKCDILTNSLKETFKIK